MFSYILQLILLVCFILCFVFVFSDGGINSLTQLRAFYENIFLNGFIIDAYQGSYYTSVVYFHKFREGESPNLASNITRI